VPPARAFAQIRKIIIFLQHISFYVIKVAPAGFSGEGTPIVNHAKSKQAGISCLFPMGSMGGGRSMVGQPSAFGLRLLLLLLLLPLAHRQLHTVAPQFSEPPYTLSCI
jgi:hypothetical protein